MNNKVEGYKCHVSHVECEFSVAWIAKNPQLYASHYEEFVNKWGGDGITTKISGSTIILIAKRKGVHCE